MLFLYLFVFCEQDHTNNEAIWTEISSREQELKQLGSVEWANEFFQDAASTSQINQQKDLIDTVDDNKSQYSKVRDDLVLLHFECII